MVTALVLAVALAATAAAVPPPLSVREIVELTDLSSVALSPDGRTVVYRAETASVAANSYALAWYIVPVDGSLPPRRLADAGEGDRQNGFLMSNPPTWTADSRQIIYRAVANGEVQLWRVDAEGSHVVQLTHDAGNVKSFALTATGDAVVYEAGPARAEIAAAEDAEASDGIHIDHRIDPQRPLVRSTRLEGRVASDRLHGFWFADGDILADRPHRYRVLDLATQSARDASTVEAARLKPAFRPIDLTVKRLVLSEADAGDHRGRAVVAAAGPATELSIERPDRGPIVCRQPLCRGQYIVDVAWQPAADRVIFTTSDAATNQSLRLWNIATGTVQTLITAEGRLNGGRDDSHGCAVGSRVLVCIAAAANTPPHLVAIDLATRQTRTLADPNAGLIRPGPPQFEPLSWADRAGHRFTGQLMVPLGQRNPVPLFVTYYACDGYLRGGVGDEYPLRQLAADGIAALCINRLPTALGLGDQIEEYRLALAGVSAAIERLVGRKLVDPARVGMAGLSFGSEVTGWVATHSDLLAAAAISSILLAPSRYWSDVLVGPDVVAIRHQVWGVGEPDHDFARWREISPVMNIAAFHAPLLMQMSEQEFRDNLELAAKLRLSPTPVDLWVYPDEPHIKVQPRHQFAVYERNLDWFRFWLQGYIDPAPAKLQQYRFWQSFDRKPGWHIVRDQPGVPGSGQPRSQTSVSTIGRR